jgi:hypothetical protein
MKELQFSFTQMIRQSLIGVLHGLKPSINLKSYHSKYTKIHLSLT